MEIDVMHGPILNAEQIIKTARDLAISGKKKMVAVAGASDVDVLGAVSSAHTEGILDATLFGDKGEIEKTALCGDIDISGFNIEHDDDVEMAVYGAVRMAAEGNADVVMKGFVSTSHLLKTVLSKDFNLRMQGIVSHSAVLGIPGRHKLLQMTDGGMVVRPDVDQKIQIMQNAIMVGKALGLSPVKVALSAAVDRVYEKHPQSIECQEVLEKVQGMHLEDVEIQGPMTFDVAASREMAELKGIKGPVAGDADIYLVGTIEECNIVAKALINFADTIFAGVIVGARVPVSLVSRTDSLVNKKASVSIACLVADYYGKIGISGGAA